MSSCTFFRAHFHRNCSYSFGHFNDYVTVTTLKLIGTVAPIDGLSESAVFRAALSF